MEEKLLQLSKEYGFDDAVFAAYEGEYYLLLFAAYLPDFSTPPAGSICVSPYYPASQRGYNSAKRLMEAMRTLGLSPQLFSKNGLKRMAAGRLGNVGKNTLFYHPRFGSYISMQAIALGIKVYVPGYRPSVNFCGDCTACESACPTHAIADGVFCRENCVREYMGRPEIDPRFGSHIYRLAGCDRCQTACPKNGSTSLPAYSFDILELLSGKHISEIKKLIGSNFGTRTRILNQALYYAANTGYTQALPAIRKLAGDEFCGQAASYALQVLEQIGMA